MRKIPTGLNEIQKAIPQALAAIDQLQAATYGKSEAKADILARATHAAGQFDRWARSHLARGETAALFRPRPSRPNLLLETMAGLMGSEALAARLSEYVSDLPDSVDAATFAKSKADADAYLYALEDAEEIAVMALEARGEHPTRRADARPEIVLKRRD